MSVKKQTPSSCKLHSFYDEIPEEFLYEPDVDSFFHHKIFNIFQSQHWIVRVSKISNKKSLAMKLFEFCEKKTQQQYIFQEEVNISGSEISSVADRFSDFFESFDKASKFLRIPLPKAKTERASTKSKDNLFEHYYNDIIEHPHRHK